MPPGEFREIGHRLVDQIADRLAKLPDRPGDARRIAGGRSRARSGAEQTLPPRGTDAGRLVSDATELLFDHSLFNGHPRFFGYITSSPAPIGMFGDFLAAALNQNVGAWRLAPLATEIEGQAVRWIAELIGFPTDCGGLLVSGGNMANFVCFVAARAAKAPWDVRKEGLSRDGRRLLVYASTETHTWIQKAADLFGLGTDAIRWIATDDRAADGYRRRCAARSSRISGSAINRFSSSAPPARSAPAPSIRCRRSPRSAVSTSLWFHVDGAYGALAAQAPGIAGEPARVERRRFGRRRSAQMALRAARSRLRAGARRRAGCATPSRITRPTTTSTIRS